jgi:hypothetical protein
VVFLFSCVLSFITISIGGLFISNKVAGPIHRLTQYMLKNNVSDATVFKFRKGDYFIELQDAFNEFINKK